MIIPVGDINPRRTTPVVNYLLLLANIGVFIYEVVYLRSNVEAFEGYIGTYALRPDRWQDGKTLFTSMFMHGDIAHLAGNMLFLWIAGDNVEDRLGHVPYLVFYLVAGLVGAAAHVAFALLYAPSMAAVPTLGASGAISGVLGAYLAFFPGSKIKFILWLIIFVRPFTLPSWGAIGFWVVSQIFMARNQMDGIDKGESAMVAVFAHLGGFAFGLVFAAAVRMFGKAPQRKSSN
jgi:membrane associated rhomboid family serine protease